MDNSDRIDADNLNALGEAYNQLLAVRNDMLDAVSAVPEQSPSLRETIVDSVILGVLHRLHEVANNLDKYEQLITETGGGFPGHTREVVNEVKLFVTQLKAGNPSVGTPSAGTPSPSAPDKGALKARAIR